MELKIKGYLRYGDDFVVFGKNKDSLSSQKKKIIEFLNEKSKLDINYKNDSLHKTKHGLKFLGVEVFIRGLRLNQRNRIRINEKLERKNLASYDGMVKRYGSNRTKTIFDWEIIKILENVEKLL